MEGIHTHSCFTSSGFESYTGTLTSFSPVCLLLHHSSSFLPSPLPNKPTSPPHRRTRGSSSSGPFYTARSTPLLPHYCLHLDTPQVNLCPSSVTAYSKSQRKPYRQGQFLSQHQLTSSTCSCFPFYSILWWGVCGFLKCQTQGHGQCQPRWGPHRQGLSLKLEKFRLVWSQAVCSRALQEDRSKVATAWMS